MRISLTLCLFLSFSFVYAQNNSVNVRVNQFISRNIEEVVDVDTLLLKPNRQNNDNTYNTDISYRRKLNEGNGFVVRLGLIKRVQKIDRTELLDDNSGYANSKDRLNSNTFTLNFGAFHEFYRSSKIIANVGAEIPLQYRPQFTETLEIRYFDSQDEYLGASEYSIDFPRRFGVGLNLNASLHYLIFDFLSAGVELNVQFLYYNTKGNMNENPKLLDENDEVVNQLNIPHIIKYKEFQFQDFISLALQYHF